MEKNQLESSICEKDLGVLDYHRLNLSQQSDCAAKKTIAILGCINWNSSTESKSGEVIVPQKFCGVLIQFWVSQFKKESLEQVHGKDTKIVNSQRNNIYEEWLKDLGRFNRKYYLEELPQISLDIQRAIRKEEGKYLLGPRGQDQKQ